MKIQRKKSIPGQEKKLINRKMNILKGKVNRKDPKMMSIAATMDFGPVDFMAHISRHRGDIMMVATVEPVTLQPTATIINAVRLMSVAGIRRIPVTNAGTNRLEGMITSIDIIDFLGGGSKKLLIEKHYQDNFLIAMNAEIRSIMCDEVIYVNREAKIADVIKIMIEKNIGGIPVVNEAKVVCGICTDRDFLELIAGIPANKSISQYMSKTVEETPSDYTIEDAARIMVEKGYSQIPVMEGGMLLGIVTASDILEYIATGHAFEKMVTGNFHEVMKETVGSLTKRETIFVTPDVDLGRAAQIMISSGVNSLPVMENGVFCGIVTSRDILNAISE
ncbi:CBS domain-containing protein [Methanolobus zinderi]|uniref:CBS domain-containing protein n=1 Tax=Methanolobus zinderi TaxID=536044 RepID=A0A7D5E6H3_9EURY|nr:CBS domain-containing protein [Methanolobus zinderi]QLC48999.1 CBS domain-containing protein [Methanolobus zinderi]